MLDVRDVTVSFDGRPVLDDVSLRVDEGEVVGLLGPSGSGKSTILRVVAGLITPAAGTVRIGGRDVTHVPTHRRGVGMVFQDEQLFPHRDVAANVSFGLRMLPEANRPLPAQRAQRVAELLAVVGLSGFEHRRVTDLSGGEAKRVALARSLAPHPSVLLLDEPLTGLDRDLHDRLATEVAHILRSTGTTSVLVTHDATEADAVADRVLRMEDLRVGIVIVELAPEETHRLRARVLRAGTPSADLQWAGDDAPGTIHLGARRGDALVAISTWMPKPFPGDDDRPAVQLRGMAVDPAEQGRGVGSALLIAGVERAFTTGADSVWANARDTALDFYRRHGFEVVGDGFVQRETALPHHRIRRFPFSGARNTQEG